MKQQDVFNKIGIIIKELTEQYEYLQTQPGQLGDLDLEIFIANAHFLADNAAVLRKLNAQPAPAKAEAPKTTSNEEKYFGPLKRQPEPVATPINNPSPIRHPAPVESKPIINTTKEDRPIPSINLSAEAPEDNYSYARQEPETTIRHDLVVDESWYDGEDELAAPPIAQPAFTKPAESAPPMPAEIAAKVHQAPVSGHTATKNDDSVLTINQRIAAQMGNKQTGEPTAQPITDLKAAITLNEKLRFIKDLFNSYSLAYSEAIEILNRFNKFDDADQFLKANYVAKNNWESKPETTEMFYDLLKRRYL